MVVAIGECANIRGIEGLRTTMLEALQAHDAVELDASQVEDADLSFLQLVEAARKLAAAEGKPLALTAPANPFLAALLERAGFLADGDPSARAFWFKGDVR
ncbi:MAG: STAS domain-containing protein [Novosphingobium sp.]|nr:STAS domain-containing protein [Novosphingobium sp.]